MEKVRVPRLTGAPMRAALAVPAGAARHPAVIVIHEIFGLNGDIRAKAQHLADLGYVALAPDLYDGPGPRPLCVVRTVQSLSRGRGPAFDDLEASRAFLSSHPRVDPARLGVIGFCLGGGFALLFAARAPLGAAAVFYGAVPQDAGDIEGVCPVVAGYGARDRTFARQGRRLEDFLTRAGVAHDVKVYPGAGHSYMSPHRGALAKIMSWGPTKVGFDEAASDDSWQRVEAFFAEHLSSA